MKKQLLALLLAMLTLLPLLVACRDTPEKPTDTTAAESTKPEMLTILP